MAKTNFPPKRLKVLLCSAAYFLVVAGFLGLVAQYYLPGKGFTYLVMFGDQRSADYLPELRATDHYEMENSYGYDAQYYAQIAMRPALGDPELVQAVDNLPYRARRILLSWVAYVLAGGDAVRALHIFAFQNVVCWFALAIVMFRWFPPTGLNNFIRWAGVLLSFGMCLSVRGALVDGPSLLLIAIAVLLYEQGRSWWSTLVLAVAGLGKETNILAGSALLDPAARGWRRWLVMGAQGTLVLLPLALWMVYLTYSLGSGGGTGSRNFDLPFVAYFTKWQVTLNQLQAEGFQSVAKWSGVMLVALTVQLMYFLVQPQWRKPWWRVGISYSVLMVALGDAVWEGYPGAASRVLLPMTLAFNILVPRGRGWFVPLLLGNLTVFAMLDALKPPGGISYTVEGAQSLRIEAVGDRPVEVVFDENWYKPERSRFEYWVWNAGSSRITLKNPYAVALTVDISFQLRSDTDRMVAVKAGDVVLWTGALGHNQSPEVMLAGYRLEPRDTIWFLETDQPATAATEQDLRTVAFNLRDLTLRIRGVAP